MLSFYYSTRVSFETLVIFLIPLSLREVPECIKHFCKKLYQVAPEKQKSLFHITTVNEENSQNERSIKEI